MTNGKYEKIGYGILNKYALSGHIVWYKDKINLLTDTYQDKSILDGFIYIILKQVS